MSNTKRKIVTAALGLSLAVSSLGLIACSPSSQAVEPLTKTTLTESELDQVVGSYTYEGKTTELTARQVISDAVSLDAAKNPDGNYRVPGADMVLTYARNAVLNTLVQKEGIQVSDEDVLNYIKSTLNVESVEELAQNYGMSTEQAQKILKETVGVQKLREKVSNTQAGPTEPTAPTVPEEGKESEATEAYAQYIVGLLGDEWDSEKGTWAREDGPYYAALSKLNFDGKTATFEQAQTAYYVAYGNFTTAQQSLTTAWTDYVNTEFAKATVSTKMITTF